MDPDWGSGLAFENEASFRACWESFWFVGSFPWGTFYQQERTLRWRKRTIQHESLTSEAASLAEVVGRCQAARRCSSGHPRSNCRENAIVETARCEMRCDFDVKQLDQPVRAGRHYWKLVSPPFPENGFLRIRWELPRLSTAKKTYSQAARRDGPGVSCLHSRCVNAAAGADCNLAVRATNLSGLEQRAVWTSSVAISDGAVAACAAPPETPTGYRCACLDGTTYRPRRR